MTTGTRVSKVRNIVSNILIFLTEESQSGLLLFFLGARTRDRLLVSHEEWLRALKERAEEIRN